MIVLDTGGLYAAMNGAEALHVPSANALRAARAPRFLSPFVLAELDYLVGTRIGPAARLALAAEVGRGAYQLEPFDLSDVRAAEAIMRRYADLDLGIADASVVVLAERHGTLNLLCTDQRHFRALRTRAGESFRLLPFDEPTP